MSNYHSCVIETNRNFDVSKVSKDPLKNMFDKITKKISKKKSQITEQYKIQNNKVLEANIKAKWDSKEQNNYIWMLTTVLTVEFVDNK